MNKTDYWFRGSTIILMSMLISNFDFQLDKPVMGWLWVVAACLYVPSAVKDFPWKRGVEEE